jgi:hypothetical protein
MASATGFVFLGTEDYEQLGDAYPKNILSFQVGADGVSLTPAATLEGAVTGPNYLRPSRGVL